MNLQTLSLYIIRLYCKYFFIISLIIFGVFVVGTLFDIFNGFRSVHVSTKTVWKLALYYTPHLYNHATPLISFATMLFLLKRLTESNELTIMFCSGISIWKILALLSITVVILGVFVITVINPIGAYGLEQSKQLKLRLKKTKESDVILLHSGILLREEYGNENRIIRAKAINLPKKELTSITILFFDKNNDLLKRVDADSGIVSQGSLNLINPKVIINKNAENYQTIEIPTSLSINNFTTIFRDPESITIPALRKTIDNLIKYGLPANNYEIYYYKQLLKPIIMLTTLILASTFFSLKDYNNIQNKLLFCGLLVSVILYGLSEIVIKILFHYNFHAILAILIPNLFVFFISSFIILHLHEA